MVFGQASAKPKPNLIWIVADDLGCETAASNPKF